MPAPQEKDFRDIDKMGIVPDDREDESDDGFNITGDLGDVEDDIAEVLKTDYAKVLQNNILNNDNEIVQVSDRFSGLHDISDGNPDED